VCCAGSSIQKKLVLLGWLEWKLSLVDYSNPLGHLLSDIPPHHDG
jgi:hypothetical protein